MCFRVLRQFHKIIVLQWASVVICCDQSHRPDFFKLLIIHARSKSLLANDKVICFQGRWIVCVLAVIPWL